MNQKTHLWLRGLIEGFIKGGAHSVTAGSIVTALDPQHAHFWHWLYIVACCFLGNGLLSTMFYLQRSPMPVWDGTTERRTK